MYVLFIVLIVVAALALILFVLVQNSKGGGLASGFSSPNNILGVKKATDVVEKITWGLISAIVVMCVAASGFAKHADTTKASSAIATEVANQQAQQPQQTVNFNEQVPADSAN